MKVEEILSLEINKTHPQETNVTFFFKRSVHSHTYGRSIYTYVSLYIYNHLYIQSYYIDYFYL